MGVMAENVLPSLEERSCQWKQLSNNRQRFVHLTQNVKSIKSLETLVSVCNPAVAAALVDELGIPKTYKEERNASPLRLHSQVVMYRGE